jgi:hypothetical protein
MLLVLGGKNRTAGLFKETESGRGVTFSGKRGRPSIRRITFGYNPVLFQSRLLRMTTTFGSESEKEASGSEYWATFQSNLLGNEMTLSS